MAVLILFSFFSCVLIGAALTVVFARNTLYSALALIVAFINASILMLLAGGEFISFVVIILYVGAVAVLILFVVMMLNLNIKGKIKHYGLYLPAVLTAGVLLVLELGALAYFFKISDKALDRLSYPRPSRTKNIVALGQHLYTHYAYIFEIGGLILFVAMIGAIVLTMGIRPQGIFKRQNLKDQLKRSPENSLVMTTPKIGAGVSPDMTAALVHSGVFYAKDES